MKLLTKLFAGALALGGAHSQAAEFVPVNDLERALIRAQTGKLSVPDFFAHLLTRQVVILLDRAPPESGVWDNSISPLVLTSPTGTKVLAIFTSTDRATPTSLKSTHHQYALLTDFTWVLKGIAPQVGIVINPGWPVGVEIEPSRVAELNGGAK